jgi:3-oxoacyl-[acyl-carrier protein] reductase
MPVTLDISNKVAVISGGSRGIGAACVRLFAEAGAKVVFNYQKARREADELSRSVGVDRCEAVRADLDSADSARKLIDAAVARFGRVDIVVGNHGIWPSADTPINEMTDEHWRRTMAINLDSIFGLIKHGVAQIKKQNGAAGAGGQGGHVVLISSTAGQRGEAFHADYAASKGAVISMTKGLATELARDHIYVNCVAPGWVQTDMAAPALNDPKTREWAMSFVPLKRPGKPEEIAASVLFLCTKHAGFITGEILNVNGGAVLIG